MEFAVRAVVLLFVGLAAGIAEVWPDFRSLEGQRYWSKRIYSQVAATPGSHLEGGGGRELFLVGPPGWRELDKLLKDVPRVDYSKLAKQAGGSRDPAKATDVTIMSFGYTSADPPGLGEYGLLVLAIFGYAAVPFASAHAVDRVVTHFRAKPPRQAATLWAGIAVFVAMGIYPPWIQEYQPPRDPETRIAFRLPIAPTSAGYYWIFGHPYHRIGF